LKKIINHADTIVDEMLNGMVKAHTNHLKRLPGTTIVVRKQLSETPKVGIVSGGGSGHEPSHTGYVGKGMLDAAVAGEVFTSPTPDQVLEAIKAVDQGKGVLLVIKNYNGDVMNFEMAAELAEIEGIKVDHVIVNDDIAVEDSTHTSGRRGVAGTFLVHKAAGALAEKGASLDEIKRTAEQLIEQTKSLGVALSPAYVPGSGNPGFEIGDDEIEIGIGIHGEPGISREKLKKANEIADLLLNKIISELELKNGDEVGVLVNGLGSTPLMELYVLNNRVTDVLEEKGIRIAKTFVGEFMTAIEMAGASITLAKLDPNLKELLFAPAQTPAFTQTESGR
jgi:dihydroxyacetone kinase-like protein